MALDLELTVMSAWDLKKVTRSETMDVYVVVSISGHSGSPYKKYKTPVDRNGGSNPSWNSSVALRMDEAKLAELTVVFDIKQKRTFRRDKKVGQVKVPFHELGNSGKYTYGVQTPSGELGGYFEFLVKVPGSDRTRPTVKLLPPPPPPAVDDESKVISWVSAYRHDDHHRAYHRRHPSW